MALSAAACAEKYSINDCEANIAIAARKFEARRRVQKRKPAAERKVTCMAVCRGPRRDFYEIAHSTLHMRMTGACGAKAYEEQHAHGM